MNELIRLVGPNQAVELFGVKLVGVNADNGKKLLFTLCFIAAVFALTYLAKAIARAVFSNSGRDRVFFWTRQGIKLGGALILILGIASVWFDDPSRLATALGLVTAGLAFALQRVVTAIAGYFVILRGRTFNVGDRITMGGVRGDVIALDFTQTTLMEMGQPPSVQAADPAMWVKSREYTGRIVTITNSKIFEEPIYNYTKEFPYIWEEMSIPISYSSDRVVAEKIILAAAEKYTVDIAQISNEALLEMQRRYFVSSAEMKPKVYCRLTDNWVELTVRFIVRDRGIRDIKDKISREIINGLDKANIGIASATFEVTGFPPITFDRNSQEFRPQTYAPEPNV